MAGIEPGHPAKPTSVLSITPAPLGHNNVLGGGCSSSGSLSDYRPRGPEFESPP